MASGVSYDVNFDSIGALVDAGPRVAREWGNEALLAGAVPIKSAIKAKAPVSHVDEPHLRDSVDTKVLPPEGNKCTVLIGFDEPAARHAGFVEFGTAKMQAEPFIRPAIDEQGQAAVDAIAASLWANIAKAASEKERVRFIDILGAL
jgi:HK97 gp10 family phage protein